MPSGMDGPRQHELTPELSALRTQVANQAASLAEAVTNGFEGFHMGAGDYIVDLQVPEGPSTGGGVQARQSIRLVPRRSGYAVVVAGTVDPVTSTAEVRTFDHVAVLHELRFRRPLEINADEYTAFLGKLDIVLNLARVRSRRVPPTDELLTLRSRQNTATTRALVLLLSVTILAAIVVFLVLRTRLH